MPRSSRLSQAEDLSQTFLNCEGIIAIDDQGSKSTGCTKELNVEQAGTAFSQTLEAAGELVSVDSAFFTKGDRYSMHLMSTANHRSVAIFFREIQAGLNQAGEDLFKMCIRDRLIYITF